MEDIDRAFRKHLAEKMDKEIFADLVAGGCTSSSVTERKEEPFTIDKIYEAMALLGDVPPPPPLVRFSKHAMVEPSAEPHTDDMRSMLEALGREMIPGALRIAAIPGLTDRDLVVIHPDFVKKGA